MSDADPETGGVFSTRLSPEVGAEVESFAAERGLSKSAAMEKLVAEGLAVVQMSREEDAVLPAVIEELDRVDTELDNVGAELDRLSGNIAVLYQFLRESDIPGDTETLESNWEA